MRSLLFVATAALLAAGLAFADDPAKPAAAPARAKAPAGASVFIVSPKNGETVGQDVTVKFGVKGIDAQAGHATRRPKAATTIC